MQEKELEDQEERTRFGSGTYRDMRKDSKSSQIVGSELVVQDQNMS